MAIGERWLRPVSRARYCGGVCGSAVLFQSVLGLQRLNNWDHLSVDLAAGLLCLFVGFLGCGRFVDVGLRYPWAGIFSFAMVLGPIGLALIAEIRWELFEIVFVPIHLVLAAWPHAKSQKEVGT